MKTAQISCTLLLNQITIPMPICLNVLHSFKKYHTLTWARVNPEVAVLCSASFSHFSGVTCLATKLWVDLISGKGAAFNKEEKKVWSFISNSHQMKKVFYVCVNLLHKKNLFSLLHRSLCTVYSTCTHHFYCWSWKIREEVSSKSLLSEKSQKKTLIKNNSPQWIWWCCNVSENWEMTKTTVIIHVAPRFEAIFKYQAPLKMPVIQNDNRQTW